MPYTTNPKMPRLRAKAARIVHEGKTVSEVARYFGYTKGAVSKWVKKCPRGGAWIIPTESSRPHHHPNELPKETVELIVSYKKRYDRCAEVVHRHLENDGISVSLNSVKRKLDEAGLVKKRSPWKRLHLSKELPDVVSPGDLVMVDTIHLMVNGKKRIYVYTLIDVHSRWSYAWATDRIGAKKSVEFMRRVRESAPFEIRLVQSDNGPEFTTHFSERIKVLHRHSRIRKPNDNSYVERFNRTLQEECLREVRTDVRIYNRILPVYLEYYNTERLHLGIGLSVPIAKIN
ncbi:MAG: DDE-type integrase/transposase/recombinase [Candidatus Moranbacteria bacterium]|nr:DDE-type integrase/transposase/recombinase [Candidatus Moranbacteria bacterium]